MKNWENLCRFLLAIALMMGVSACAVAPGPYYYSSGENSLPQRDYSNLSVGLNDRNYVMQVYDHTPFRFDRLPHTENLLYGKGYDRVRRERDADFAINVTIGSGVRDNPGVRAGNTLGGALAGAAAGAIIGGALGDPGAGAAIGAASGGFLGLAAPAGTGVMRIDVDVWSFRDGIRSHSGATLDLAQVPPEEVYRLVDNEIARMVQTLPTR